MGARRLSRQAFTLIEVLVATVILALLLIVLSQILRFVASAWSTGSSNSERRQNGRALADFIGQELRAATLPVNSHSISNNLQFALNPPQVTATNCHPSSLFWLAPVATDNAGGDLAEVGYFVRWVTSKTGPRPQLCRFFVNPSATNNYLVYTNNEWVKDQLLDTVAPADSSSGYVGLFAENVIGFWARCFDASGTQLAAANGSYDSRVTPALPATVEISLMMLDNRSAARLNTSEQARLITLTGNTATAADCLSQVQADPSLKAISSGIRAYTTRVFLENSR